MVYYTVITQRDATYKNTAVSVYVMKASEGVEVSLRPLLSSAPGERLVVSFMLQSIYPRGRSPRYPLSRRLAGPHNRSGRFGGQKNFFSMLVIEPRFLGPGAFSMVYRLRYPFSDLGVEYAVLLKWVWQVQREDLEGSEMARDKIQ
jgi:hypothetical protein